MAAVLSNTLLHLRHKKADRDDLGSAFSLNRPLSRDVGITRSVKASVHGLVSIDAAAGRHVKILRRKKNHQKHNLGGQNDNNTNFPN